MSASTQVTSNYSTKPCRHCGAKELLRTPRKLIHRLFAIYPYVCGRCANRESKVRLRLGLIFRLLMLALMAGAGAYFYGHPISLHRGEDTSQNASAEALVRARSAAGGLSAFEQMMIKKPRTTMDNATILQLWRANVGPNVILQLIRTSTPDYDVSASSVIELKQAGVDQSIILAMIDASYNAR